MFSSILFWPAAFFPQTDFFVQSRSKSIQIINGGGRTVTNRVSSPTNRGLARPKSGQAHESSSGWWPFGYFKSLLSLSQRMSKVTDRANAPTNRGCAGPKSGLAPERLPQRLFSLRIHLISKLMRILAQAEEIRSDTSL